MVELTLQTLLGEIRFRSTSYQVRVVDSIDSTNKALVEDRNAVDGAVLIARSQTAGRGRLGRSWIAPVDSALLMSVLLLQVETITVEHWPLLSFAMGMAVTEASQLLGVRSSVKWPNDVIVADATSPLGYRKLAGILAEAAVIGEDKRVVVGVGVNLFRPERQDPGLGPEAVPTWLGDRCPDFVPDGLNAEHFTASVLRSFAVYVELLIEQPDQFLATYRSHCVTLGQAVRVELGTGTLLGQAVNIDDTGRLIVEADGTSHVVSAGDVIHLRPM